MSGTISQSSYNRLLPLFKSKDELDRNLARDGIEVVPDPPEAFNPVRPEAAAQLLDDGDYGVSDLSVNAGSGGPEEEETDLTAKTSAAPQGLSALSSLAAEQKKSIGTLYDQITQDIQRRYRAPDIGDLLMAVGMGMMSPPGENDQGGFGGSLMRGLRGIGSYAQSRQAYKSDINKMLANIDVQKAKSLADLEERYLAGAFAASKPSAGGLSYDTQRGIFVNRNNPRPTENVYNIGGGRTLVQWQDGLWREKLPDGGYKVFERSGNDFSEVGTEGAR